MINKFKTCLLSLPAINQSVIQERLYGYINDHFRVLPKQNQSPTDEKRIQIAPIKTIIYTNRPNAPKHQCHAPHQNPS